MYEVIEMEKLVMKFGFAIFLFCAMCAVLVGSHFIWGAGAGAAITLFAWFFDEG